MSILDISKYSENIIDNYLKQMEQRHLEKLQIIATNYSKCYQHIQTNQKQIKNNQDEILTTLKNLILKTDNIQNNLIYINKRINQLENSQLKNSTT